jgi:hypothetical protein
MRRKQIKEKRKQKKLNRRELKKRKEPEDLSDAATY